MTARDLRTVTISLTPSQAERLRNAVENGEYASDSDIVHDALDLWQQRKDFRALELERLKQAYAEGKASGDGETVDPAAFLASLKAERSAGG